jgi:hypothetical protein
MGKKNIAEEAKAEGNYKGFTPRDPGYFLTFEHENEAKEFYQRKQSHMLFAELLGDKDPKPPCFFAFQEMDSLCKGKLGERLFSLSARATIGSPSINLDMAMLKRLMLRVSASILNML